MYHHFLTPYDFPSSAYQAEEAMAHNYDVGTRAWQPDPTEGWVASEVESKTIEGDRVKLVFRLATGEVFDGS